MSLRNIKIEPSEVDVSSNEDLSNMVSSYSYHPKTTETRCSICLQGFTNKCYTDSCIHMFCFECLKKWSASNSTCPLCKKVFQQIHHSLSEFTHETYEIPRQRLLPSAFQSLTEMLLNSRNNLFLDTIRRSSHNEIQPEVRFSANGLIQSLDNSHTETIVNEMRLRVYRENVWAEPLLDSSGRLRDCSSSFLRENPIQLSRLRHFIIRDVQAIIIIEQMRINLSLNEIYVIDLIMRSILRHEIRDSHTNSILVPYLGPHAAHFCHELYNFASSPFDRLDYDVNVRYNPYQQSHSSAYQNTINALDEIRVPPLPALAVPYNPHMEIIGLNSGDSITGVESRPYPNDIAIQSSSSDNLFGQIRNFPFQPIESFNSLNQPSFSSTGIQETIMIDSDDSIIEVESRQYPNDIAIQSAFGDDSVVEILNPPLFPIEVSNLRDQPTSTGIQDSVDRPNNRYNLRRRTNQQLETISLSSNDSIIGVESRQYPNDIAIQSASGDDSVVEILNPPLFPIEVSNFRDQPTSTGIQDSVDRPNNRYNLRRRTNQQLETISLSSNDSIIGVESRRYPNNITIQSSASDNIGIVTLRPPLHPIEEFSTSSNRPSTPNIGQSSVNRPNSRYNLRRRR